MDHRAARLPICLLVLAILLTACGDDTPAPEPGQVVVSLVSPSGPEGGAVFDVSGESITSAESGASTVFVRQVEGRTRIILVREPAGALEFVLDVENIHQPPTVEMVEVAGPDDELRSSLSGYRVDVEAVR